MDFNFKGYQKIKIKKHLKNNGFFLLFHSAKLNLAKWLFTEQNLKKLKLNYYKPLNKIALKIFKSSIYKNFNSSLVGFILLISAQYKSTILNLPLTIKTLKPSFTLVSVKLNNKIYSTTQLKGLDEFSYKKSILNLHKVLDKQLKTTYVLTNRKKNSK